VLGFFWQVEVEVVAAAAGYVVVVAVAVCCSFDDDWSRRVVWHAVCLAQCEPMAAAVFSRAGFKWKMSEV